MAKVNYRRDKMIVLLKEYSRIKDALLDHTEHLHDSMFFDIEGYWDAVTDGDYDQLEVLEMQVNAFTMILEGYKNIYWVYC